jgi:protein required for attachment to host cells
MNTAKQPTVWVVIADGAHAAVLTPAKVQGRFQEVEAIKAPPYPHAHQSHAPIHNLDPAAKAHFARDIAKWLDTTAASFDQLVLVAPGHTLHDLRGALGHVAAGKLVDTETKDIVKLPIAERDAHLARWWLAPAEAA